MQVVEQVLVILQEKMVPHHLLEEQQIDQEALMVVVQEVDYLETQVLLSQR
jgi:hypothetical protein